MELEKTGMRFFLALPDLISLLNLSFGFLAILLVLNGNILLASIFIIISVVCDSVDGWLGRKLVEKMNMGLEQILIHLQILFHLE